LAEGVAVIPTLILVGLIFGRWWRYCVITAAVGWPLLLVAIGVVGVNEFGVLLEAAGLAVINTGVGVLIHQGGLSVVRRLRRHSAAPPNRPLP
jgi:hypothetical protein